MKYLFFLYVFLLQMCLSQNYYPLGTGNQWFFDSTNNSVKVVNDSIFPNGKTYSILNRPDYISGKYVRVDSQYIYYYDSSKSQEQRVFKLNGIVGDTTKFLFYYYMISRIEQIDTIELFGEKTRIIKYTCDGLVVTEFTFSDKFGLIRVDDYGDPPSPFPIYVSTLKGCIIDGKKYGYTTYVGRSDLVVNKFNLFQNYPNPFNPTTTFKFSLATSGYVKLNIIDYLGREVTTLISANLNAGEHKTIWNAQTFSSGVYFYRLTFDNKSEIKKLVLLR